MESLTALPAPRCQAADPAVVNLDLEAEILGALIMVPGAVAQVEPILRPDHFSEHLHALVYAAILAIVAESGNPSSGQLYQRLGPRLSQTAVANGVSVKEYLARLACEGGTTGHALTVNARAVRDLWALRQVAALGTEIREREAYSPAALLADAFERLDDLRASLGERDGCAVLSGLAASELAMRIEAALKGERRERPRSAIDRLDEALGGGFQPATLVVVAARTAMGKSILGIEIADRVARQGYGVVYHSLEMSRLQVAARQISSRLERKGRRVSFEAILRAERLTRDDAEAVALQASELRDESLLIEDRGGVSIASIAAATERRIAAFERRGVRRGIVVIDHAHQVAASGRHDREEGRIREVSAGALALAKRLDIPVVLLAQLNRQTEARDDKRPGPADLRGSGALEEDCDALIFPFRPAYYIERSARYRAGDPAAIAEYEAAKHALELILDKNRAGRSNQVIHAWIDPALNAIRNRGERRDIP